MRIQVIDWGIVPYTEAHRRQEELVLARLRGEIPDTLLLLEHPAVVTLGRGTEASSLLDAKRLPVIPCERGGDATLHAPGQVVGYLIRLLPPGARDLHAHLRLLEELILRTLARFGVAGERVPGRTGVWVDSRKIASLGVACRQWCTWHGFALNVDMDLSLFEVINPCGFPASVMTSLARERALEASVARVKETLAREAQDLAESWSVDGLSTGP